MNFQEIEESPALRGIGALLCLYFFMTFSTWPVDLAFTRQAYLWNTALPWPWFEGVATLLSWFPSTLARAIFQGLGLLAMACLGAFFFASRCRSAMLGLLVLSLAKLFFYFLDLRQVANFHHMHLYFCFFFLFASPRMVWLRISLALVYEMAALVKLSPSWLLGDYFSSLPSGLPLLPHNPGFIALACQSVIALEFLGPVLFFAPWPKLRQLSVASFFAFHLYSGVIVGIWYTSLMLPFLLLLFSDGFRHPLRWADLKKGPWVARLGLIVMALLGVWALVIPGDVRITAEGRYLGLFMFDANHRSRALLSVEKAGTVWDFDVQWPWPNSSNGQPCQLSLQKNGQAVPGEMQQYQGVVFFHPAYFQSLSTRVQNDPYVYVHWARQVERRLQPERISLQLFCQLDGHEEEFQTLDVDNFTALRPSYNPFWHNSWVRLGPAK